MTNLNFLRIVVQRAVTNADKTTILDNFDQSGAIAQRLGSTDNAQQIPTTGKANGFLETASSDIANWANACVCQEQDWNAGLFEAQQQANVRVEAAENNLPLLAKIIDFGKYRVHEAVELNSISIHAMLFRFTEHRIFHLDVKTNVLGQFN